MFELGRLGERAERHARAACERDAEQRGDPLGAVGREQADALRILRRVREDLRRATLGE